RGGARRVVRRDARLLQGARALGDALRAAPAERHRQGREGGARRRVGPRIRRRRLEADGGVRLVGGSPGPMPLPEIHLMYRQITRTKWGEAPGVNGRAGAVWGAG